MQGFQLNNGINPDLSKVNNIKRNQHQTIDAEEHKAASIDDSLSVNAQNQQIKDL